jgi:hypothetical protein
MKRNHFLLILSLLVIATLTVSCQLPQPAADTPTPTLGIQPQATNTPLPTATQQPAITIEIGTATSVPPQPEAATATSVPPAATSMPATQVLQAIPPPADASRVEFAAGTTSKSVDGDLIAGQTESYVLRANAGQKMQVNVWSPNADVFFTVYGVEGQKLVESTQKLITWSGNLPSSQDYVVGVTASGGQTSYTVTFVIDAPVTTPAASATVAPGDLDPFAAYGNPTVSDPMTKGTVTNWASPGEPLPNTENIQLYLADDKIYVSGKKLGWATWWFSWPTLDDFYLQMTADSGTCSGKDAYGVIFRGPPHKAGVSYGYVVAFSCDGSYWIYRLDGVDPWRAVDLVTWTQSSSIKAGANQRNVVGVKAAGSKLSFYANGHLLTEVTDTKYTKGRFGVFVRPDVSLGYTYRPVKVEYWDLSK